MLILGIVSMLPFPAIHLLAFLYLGACMEPIAVQQPFNLAVRLAGGKYLQGYLLVSFTNLHKTFTIGLLQHLLNWKNGCKKSKDEVRVSEVFLRQILNLDSIVSNTNVSTVQ